MLGIITIPSGTESSSYGSFNFSSYYVCILFYLFMCWGVLITDTFESTFICQLVCHLTS